MTNGSSFVRCGRNVLLLVQCVIMAHCLLSVSLVESSSVEKASGRTQVEGLESEVEVREDVDALQQHKADGKTKVVVSNSETENTFPELETDIKIPVDAHHKKKKLKNRAPQLANQSAKKSAVGVRKPKVKILDKKVKKPDALEPKSESKSGKSAEENKAAKMSDKARKRKEMYQRVHDPAYGLIKSSFGGKDHLHSLSDLRRGTKRHKSSSKKKTALKRLLKGKKKLSSLDELLSLFKPDSQKDVEHPVAVEEQSSPAEDPSKLGSKKSEPKPVPERTVTEEFQLTQKSLVQQAEGSGNPPRSIILWTAWRSGSTFLGDLLASADNTFYSYEPLFHFGTEIFDNIDDQRTRDALQLVEDLLSCDARRHPDFVRQMYELKFPLLTNKKFYKECLVAKKCEDEAFFSDVCAASDLHVLKIIRLSLRFASSILLDPRFKDLQIVYLARDPRPVIRSRRHPANSRWCSPLNPPCHDPRHACAVLDQDVGFALELQQEFPDRFFFLRYEDLSTAPVPTVEQLWQKLGLSITPEFSKYLQLTTSGKKPKEQVNDVSRNSAKHAFAWREDIAWELVQEVQDACSSVIANFGWKLFDNEQDLRNLSFPINLS